LEWSGGEGAEVITSSSDQGASGPRLKLVDPDPHREHAPVDTVIFASGMLVASALRQRVTSNWLNISSTVVTKAFVAAREAGCFDAMSDTSNSIAGSVRCRAGSAPGAPR
jgi:hypothetical protein